MINLQYTTIKDQLPDFIYEGLKEFSRNANVYHPQPPELIDKISKKLLLDKDNILLTAGADEAIQLFIKAYGQSTFVFTPTYIVYKDAKVFGCKFTEIYSIKDNEYRIKSEKIVGATLIFLANPNNPAGFTSKEEVISLVKNNPQAIVVIDEAYGDFAKLSIINEVSNYSNLAVLRTFSKSYGMAGNRIAFVYASKDLLNKIAIFSTWANVSYLSVGAAYTALSHQDYFYKVIQEINTRREEFVIFLKKNNFVIVPSLINATLIKFKTEREANRFVSYLKDNDIIVSHGNGSSNIGLDKSFVRIAIGNNEQMLEVEKIILDYRKVN